MLNCIIAVIGSNSGRKAASTPSSDMRRSARSGLPCLRMVSRKMRRASGRSRIPASMRCRLDCTARMASGWISSPVRRPSSKRRSRSSGSSAKRSGRPRSSRFCRTLKPSRTLRGRLNRPCSSGSGLMWSASSLVSRMRVSSPTALAWRK